MASLPRSFRLLGIAPAVVAFAGCGSRTRPEASKVEDSPAAWVAAAIDRAGGTDALERGRALRWDGEATVYAGDRRIRLRGTWAIQPPDSAVVATYDTLRGPEAMRRLVVAGDRGWLEQEGHLTPMPAAMLAAERDEFYLYQLMRLVPMLAGGTRLAPAAPDSLGQRGFEVRAPDRPAVYAYLDSGGRLSHLRLRITDARTGGQVWQDLWLAGSIEADGLRWPRQIRITMDGAPYFDLAIRRLRIGPRLVEPILAGPS